MPNVELGSALAVDVAEGRAAAELTTVLGAVDAAATDDGGTLTDGWVLTEGWVLTDGWVLTEGWVLVDG